MSAFCEVALALGMTLSGLCQETAAAVQPTLPADDAAAWAYTPPPEPAPPPPPPATSPAMPPIVVEKIVTIPAPAPPSPPPAPAAPPPPPPPDPYRLAMEAALAGRGRVTQTWSQVAVSPVNAVSEEASLSKLAMEGNAKTPLDLPVPAESKYLAPGRKSGQPVDNSRIVAADRYIAGILEQGINSQVGSEDGGQIVIQTSRDVFGYHGRNILIPKGSRLLCDYEAPKDAGSSRLPINCTRVLMAGHRAEIVELSSPVGDAQGYPAVTGEIDNRFQEKYGSALMLAGISTAVRLGSAAASALDDTNSVGAVADQGAQELSSKFGEITASILEQTVDLKQIVKIAQGTRVQIKPGNDWYIAPPETAEGNFSKGANNG